MDEFQFGTPARQLQVNPRLIWAVVAILAAAALVFGYMTFVASSGKQAARTQTTVVKQVASAEDIEAQTDLRSALSAADTAFMDGGTSFADAGAAQLGILDQGDAYVDSPRTSTGPHVISVRAGQTSWSAAALAADGTCWWIARGAGSPSAGPSAPATTYGSSPRGSTCNGAAAAAASSSSW